MSIKSVSVNVMLHNIYTELFFLQRVYFDLVITKTGIWLYGSCSSLSVIDFDKLHLWIPNSQTVIILETM